MGVKEVRDRRKEETNMELIRKERKMQRQMEGKILKARYNKRYKERA